MKQIVFISGKGGTGKSTIVASLNMLVKNKIIADCDVDAPDLHLLIQGELIRHENYSGAKIAQINSDQCVRCGLCRQVCRFNAINEDYSIRPMACEGCAACQVLCPTNAIQLVSVKTGETYVTKTEQGIFTHARLVVGAEGSGKLVTEVRKNLFQYQQEEDWAIIDGSPGTGCVVIASITGTDAVVAVTEPTPSGRHDLSRVLAVAEHFKVPSFVCINKYDLNSSVTDDIIADCSKRNSPVICKIPYDPAVVSALQHGFTPVDAGLNNIIEPIQSMWQQLVDILK